MEKLPNIMLILSDDMGFSDIGCYGGETETPHLDSLAQKGLRFTQFYNTARCSPSRASILTGLHPHQTGIGILTEDDGPEGYEGTINNHCVTIPEVLKQHNYRTYMSGKWHLSHNIEESSESWPNQRGFDHFYGTLNGGGSYYYPNTLTRDNENIESEAKEDKAFYYTDAISHNAVTFIEDHVSKHPDQPFFQYVAYTAPHWPLHAPKEIVDKYKGRFQHGWDQLREERLRRMIEMGIIQPNWHLTERDPSQPNWEEADEKEWMERCMEVYAAQIDMMDQGIGKIIEKLKETGQYDHTLIFFLSDNGGCAEVITSEWMEGIITGKAGRSHTRDGEPVTYGYDNGVMPGTENTYQSYGVAWANLSNTPFKLYKHWVHEGGIATPLIVHWPNGIKSVGELRHTPAQLPDIMATILEITGAIYPREYNGNAILPMEGKAFTTAFEQDTQEERTLYWEHEGNAAIRQGSMKLVRNYPADWELYDMDSDRNENTNLAEQFPETVRQMLQQYNEWAKRCGVIDREIILDIYKQRK